MINTKDWTTKVAKHTRFQAVHPGKVLNKLFFSAMKEDINQLAMKIKINTNTLISMMNGDIIFDGDADRKICKFLNLPEETIIKGQNYYHQFKKAEVSNII